MSFLIAGVAVAAIGGGLQMHAGGKQKREAEAKEREAMKETNRLKNIYSNLDTSNPYANMENKMEDLTVNQQASQFQAQQFQQSQANILSSMRGAAGGSGIAAVAQSLAKQGQLASQQAAVDIGKQEAANQMAEREAAAAIQDKEREGEIWSREAEREKQATLLGMSQAEVAAAREQAAAGQAAKMQGLSTLTSGVTSALSGGVG